MDMACYAHCVQSINACSRLNQVKECHTLKDKYSPTSMARTPLGPNELVRDRDSLSQ